MRNERQEQILQLLHKRRSMTTSQLSKAVYASLPTIRRDLSCLESRGLVRRTHGGAVLMELSQRQEVPLVFRQGERTRQKVQIARQALSLIQRGNALFLDASSTAYELARLMPKDQELTVITNSVKAAALLCQRHIRCYMLGGLMNESFLSSGGGYAADMARSFRADLMFFSANALSMEGEIMDFSETETKLRQEMFLRSERKIFLCDSGKIGKTSLHRLCHLSQVDGVICELPLPQELMKQTAAHVRDLSGPPPQTR